MGAARRLAASPPLLRFVLACVRSVALVCTVTLSSPAHGAFDIVSRTAREAGMAGSEHPTPAAGLSATAAELYGLGEARAASASVRARVGESLVALELSQFGGEVYRERSLGLSLRSGVSEDLALEVGVRALCVSARGVEPAWSGVVDAGASRRLLGRVYLIARCTNLTRARLGGSPVAQEASVGASLALPELSLHARLTSDGVGDASATLAFELHVAEWLRARAGTTTSPGTFSCGLGIGLDRAPGEDGSRRSWPCIDLAWSWHPQLGVSSFVSITYRI